MAHTYRVTAPLQPEKLSRDYLLAQIPYGVQHPTRMPIERVRTKRRASHKGRAYRKAIRGPRAWKRRWMFE
jgi:hypothetical protein